MIIIKYYFQNLFKNNCQTKPYKIKLYLKIIKIIFKNHLKKNTKHNLDLVGGNSSLIFTTTL